MAKSRKSISISVRFDVLKRDNFTCQYCGKSAPEVVLEIDHKNPYSQSQNNNIENLITSCKDCNRGKSDKDLNPHVAENHTKIKSKKDKPYSDIIGIIRSKYKNIKVMRYSEISAFLELCHNSGITREGLEFFTNIHNDWDLFVDDLDKVIEYMQDTGYCYDLFFSSEEDMFAHEIFEGTYNCSIFFENYREGSSLYLGLSDIPIIEWYKYFKTLNEV